MFLVLFSVTHACETLFPLFPFTSNFLLHIRKSCLISWERSLEKQTANLGEGEKGSYYHPRLGGDENATLDGGKRKNKKRADNLWRGKRTKTGVCAWRCFPRDLFLGNSFWSLCLSVRRLYIPRSWFFLPFSGFPGFFLFQVGVSIFFLSSLRV